MLVSCFNLRHSLLMTRHFTFSTCYFAMKPKSQCSLFLWVLFSKPVSHQTTNLSSLPCYRYSRWNQNINSRTCLMVTSCGVASDLILPVFTFSGSTEFLSPPRAVKYWSKWLSPQQDVMSIWWASLAAGCSHYIPIKSCAVISRIH